MFRRTILVGLLAVAALGATGAPVAAKSGDVGATGALASKPGAVVARGHCSGASVWKLKLSPEDGRIEVEFQVDQNRNHRLWRVALTHNGPTVWRGSRFTLAPSGSFTVRRFFANRAGVDRVVARATNVRTGEVCRGSASI
jgi:hypothetical protein